jgi:hypothetical protein
MTAAQNKTDFPGLLYTSFISAVLGLLWVPITGMRKISIEDLPVQFIGLLIYLLPFIFLSIFLLSYFTLVKNKLHFTRVFFLSRVTLILSALVMIMWSVLYNVYQISNDFLITLYFICLIFFALCLNFRIHISRKKKSLNN